MPTRKRAAEVAADNLEVAADDDGGGLGDLGAQGPQPVRDRSRDRPPRRPGEYVEQRDAAAAARGDVDDQGSSREAAPARRRGFNSEGRVEIDQFSNYVRYLFGKKEPILIAQASAAT